MVSSEALKRVVASGKPPSAHWNKFRSLVAEPNGTLRIRSVPFRILVLFMGKELDVIVYSVANGESFECAQNWVKDVEFSLAGEQVWMRQMEKKRAIIH